MQKLSTWLVIAVAGVALLAGCGSSKSKSSPSPTATGTSTSPLTAKQRVERCKSSVQKLPTLTASQKAKLKQSCEKASGSATAERKVVHEVCFEFAQHLPPGPARARAQIICRAP